MNHRQLKNTDFEALRKLVENDPGLKDALEFAEAAADLAGHEEPSPRRLRMPYVSSPKLIDRKWR